MSFKCWTRDSGYYHLVLGSFWSVINCSPWVSVRTGRGTSIGPVNGYILSNCGISCNLFINLYISEVSDVPPAFTCEFPALKACSLS